MRDSTQYAPTFEKKKFFGFGKEVLQKSYIQEKMKKKILKLGLDALPIIHYLLKHKNWKLRIAAINLLKELQPVDASFVRLLAQGFNDKDLRPVPCKYKVCIKFSSNLPSRYTYTRSVEVKKSALDVVMRLPAKIKILMLPILLQHTFGTDKLFSCKHNDHKAHFKKQVTLFILNHIKTFSSGIRCLSNSKNIEQRRAAREVLNAYKHYRNKKLKAHVVF